MNKLNGMYNFRENIYIERIKLLPACLKYGDWIFGSEMIADIGNTERFNKIVSKENDRINVWWKIYPTRRI